MNNEPKEETPIKSNIEERLNYFRLHPERLKHSMNVMKARYGLLNNNKDDKTKQKPSV